jgi:diacylglycerol kinase
MVCCALLAGLLGLFGLIFRPFSRADKAIAWRADPIPSEALSNAPKPSFSWTARARSFGFAFKGLAFLVGQEHNMRLHLCAAALVTGLGFWLGISGDDWRWIILAITLVTAAEALNTAVEQACNALGGGYNVHVRIAKDVAAGGVLICAISALAIGILVFLPHASGRNTASFPDFEAFKMCRSST